MDYIIFVQLTLVRIRFKSQHLYTEKEFVKIVLISFLLKGARSTFYFSSIYSLFVFSSLMYPYYIANHRNTHRRTHTIINTHRSTLKQTQTQTRTVTSRHDHYHINVHKYKIFCVVKSFLPSVNPHLFILSENSEIIKMLI